MLTLLYVLNSKWLLSPLLFNKLSENHLNKIFDASSKDCITSSMLDPYRTAYKWCVVVSATGN